MQVQLWPPFKRSGTTVTQRTSGDTINSTGNLTFATGLAIKSGATNTNTLTLNANDTAFITLTTGATDTCVLASAVTATTQAAGNNSTLIATTAYVDAAVGTVNSFAEILALSNITGANDIVVSTTQSISTALVDDNYFLIKAVDNDPNTASEVARVQGAADPYFSMGGSQQYKFYNSGVATVDGAATGAAFIDVSPTLTGPAATNTYAVNISPVGITIPTGTTAIAASLYVAEPIFTETGVLTLGANVYIDAAPTEGGTNYSLYVVGTSYLNGAITAPGGITGNVTGDVSGSSGTCTGNAGTVTNGVYTTDTGTVTAKMLQNAAADLGAASITIDLSNTNGAYVTNLTIDGAFSGLTYNGLTVTANGTNTLNIAAGQTLTVTASSTLTTALTVNTGTLTLTAAAANNSVLTIGAGAVSVSGANTGDNTVATALTGTPSITVNTITTTGNIELGAATDCTIARTGAGAISVEGAAVLLSGGALGTPSSGTITNCTGTLTSITLVTPALGTPASGVLTSCTGLTGTLALTANSRITFALPVTDAHCTGPTIGTIAAGYTTAIGDLVFYGTGGKWLEVDADAVATCNGMMGIALEVKNDTEAVIVALAGSFVHIDAWTLTVGNTYYAGETLGAIQNTIPTGADAIIRVVGFAIDADTLYFFPSSDQQSTVA